MKKLFIVIAVTALVMIGCGGGPKQILKHRPQVNQIENEYFSLILKPKRMDDMIVAFDLTIRNKSENDIEIDWDKTLYIDNGQTNGRFWFEGVRYSEINSPRPPDIVFPKSTFEVTIWPSFLIKFQKDKIEHLAMAAGEHGIYLTTRIKGDEINEKATFHFMVAK